MKVKIIDGCTACGACASINNEVFWIDSTAHVNQYMVRGNEDDCRAAADACPVSVIKIIE